MPQRLHHPTHFFLLLSLTILVMLLSGVQENGPIANASPLTDITIYANRDTTVRESLPTANYGSDATLGVGRDEFTLEARALIGFDLASIPSNAIIQSAVLRLRIEVTTDNFPMTGNLYAINGAWAENSVTWQSRPPLSPTLVDSVEIPGATDITVEWDVRSLVQTWHSGTTTNHGLAINAPTSVGDTTRAFTSSEGTSTTNRPRLLITYILPTATATATPTSVSGTSTPTATGTPPSPTPTPTLTPTPSPTVPAPTGSFSGRFFHDVNGNLLEDPGEPGFGGVFVYVTRDFILVGSATTDAEGRFSVAGLRRGVYRMYIGSGMPLNYELATDIGLLSDGGPLSVSIYEPTAYTQTFPLEFVPPAPPPPFPTTNLRPVRVDIVQVNTNPANPLVAGKTTMVRVYVEVTGATAPIYDVGGRIAFGDPDNPDIWRTGIESMNRITVDPALGSGSPTSPLDRTINFLVPSEMTHEGIRNFALWVNDDYGPHIRECNGCQHDNIMEAGRTFYRYRPLNMAFLRVQTGGGVVPLYSEMREMLPRVRQLYPIQRVNAYIMSFDPIDGNLDYPTEGLGCGPGWNLLLAILGWNNFWTFDPADNLYYHGFLDDTVETGRFVGCGYQVTGEAASKITAGGTSFTTAHELGHNQNWSHVACSGTEGNPDPNYPIPGGGLDWSGIDHLQQWLDRTLFVDLMAYCSPRWMSQYHYSLALATFDLRPTEPERSTSELSLQAPIPDGAGNYLAIGGMVVNGGLGTLDPGYRITMPGGSSDHPGSGPFSLEVQTSDGGVLFTRSFLLRDTGDGEGATNGFFLEVVPFADTASRIVLKYNGDPIGSREASTNAPVVQMLTPNGGEVWSATGTYTVTWSGSDADGDALSYTLQYSKDGGTTWTAITNDLATTNYEVDATVFAGSQQALIRVIASDGLNTATDTSDAPFTVAAKAPMVFILAPYDKQVFRHGSIVILDGIATDVEDGPLDGTTFVWSSDLQGSIGSGATMSTDSLLPGWHEVTLTATDSDGMSTSNTISVLIGGRIYLSLIKH